MPKDEQKIYAVISGDIIKSSKYEKPAEIPDLIKEAYTKTLKIFKEEIAPYPVDIFRGDSWQALLTAPQYSLRFVVAMRAALKSRGIDSRCAIGIGTVDSINQERLSQSMGDAFLASGKRLDEIGGKSKVRTRNNMVLSRIMFGPLDMYLGAYDVIFQLIDALVSSWTDERSSVVFSYMNGISQKDIALAWSPEPISQQAVSFFLQSAGWSAIRNSLVYFEDTCLNALP